MASQKVISDNSYKHDGGKILYGGNNTSSRWGTVSFTAIDNSFATKTPLSASHTEKAVSAGAYDTMTKGEYVATVVGTKIAGITSSLLRITASDTNRVPYNKFISYNRFNITATNIYGQNTYGVNRGAAIKLKDIAGNDLTTGEAYPSKAIPGEFVYRNGSVNPVMADYTSYN